MSCKNFVFIFVLTILFQSSTSAQEWVSYQSQQQINDLVEVGNELLMATDAGLVVMNKSTLEKTIFNKANSNLSNNHIQSITQAPNGDIWIGTYDVSFARFDGTDFQDTTTPQGDYNPLTIKFYDLKVAPNGDLWAATSQGVFRKQGQYWSLYGKDEIDVNFFEAWDLEINSEGEVFMASNMVYKFVDEEWTSISEGTQLSAYLGADLFFSNSGDLFLAGDLDKIGRFDGESWQEYNFSSDLNGSQVVKFTEDLDGSIYFNTRYNGIFKFVDNAWIPEVDEQTEAFDGKIDYFYIDERGNRWMNSNIHLSVNDDGDIQSTTISQHTLEKNGISVIHKGENGKMYFMNHSNGNIAVWSPNGNWSFLSLPSFAMPFESFSDILVFAENDIWLASARGLYHYDGNKWMLNELNPCRSFAIDSKGMIYVRSSDRIYLIDNGVVSDYNVDNSPLSAMYIASHGVDANDNLWIAEHEVNIIHKVSIDGNWTTYTGTDYPAIEKPSGDFHFDVNGNVWIPHDVVGAIKFDGTTWTNPFEGNIDQMASYSVHSIQSDVTGKTYFSHQYGVTTWFDGEFEDLLIEDVPNKFSSHAAMVQFDDEGTLWWASSRYGVFSYDTGTATSIESDFELTTNFSTYPNPASDYTTLDFTLDESSEVKAFVYNSLGQIQLSLDLGQLPAGVFQQRMDVTNLSTGFYTLQLWVNGQFSAKGMIVQ
ncbi:MAG: two-component regulator propeller domain-containing protein [Chitinophagales bacterium]